MWNFPCQHYSLSSGQKFDERFCATGELGQGIVGFGDGLKFAHHIFVSIVGRALRGRTGPVHYQLASAAGRAAGGCVRSWSIGLNVSTGGISPAIRAHVGGLFGPTVRQQGPWPQFYRLSSSPRWSMLARHRTIYTGIRSEQTVARRLRQGRLHPRGCVLTRARCHNSCGERCHGRQDRVAVLRGQKSPLQRARPAFCDFWPKFPLSTTSLYAPKRSELSFRP